MTVPSQPRPGASLPPPNPTPPPAAARLASQSLTLSPLVLSSIFLSSRSFLLPSRLSRPRQPRRRPTALAWPRLGSRRAAALAWRAAALARPRPQRPTARGLSHGGARPAASSTSSSPLRFSQAWARGTAWHYEAPVVPCLGRDLGTAALRGMPRQCRRALVCRASPCPRPCGPVGQL